MKTLLPILVVCRGVGILPQLGVDPGRVPTVS